MEVAVGGSADPAFRQVAAYAFPNPARGAYFGDGGHSERSDAGSVITGAFFIQAEGLRTLSYFTRDLAGNQASVSSAFFIDSVPPVTQLLVNGQAAGATVVAYSTDVFTFRQASI